MSVNKLNQQNLNNKLNKLNNFKVFQSLLVEISSSISKGNYSSP